MERRPRGNFESFLKFAEGRSDFAIRIGPVLVVHSFSREARVQIFGERMFWRSLSFFFFQQAAAPQSLVFVIRASQKYTSFASG